MPDELGDVLAALAERRHADREDVEPVVEVLAEAALLDEVDEAPVGRRDQAEVDADRLPRADRVDLAVLQRAEQLDLRVGRQFADLVEEERALVRLAEFAGVLVGGAGEGALLVAEEDRSRRGSSGIAPQLTVTKGLALRSLEPWMARAISSLPTPDSPSTRIGICEAAARSPRPITRSIAGLLVMMSAKVSVPDAARFMRCDLALERAELQRVLDRDLEALGRDRLDDEVDRAGAHRVTTVSMPPWAVWTMTGMPRPLAELGEHAMPSSSGMTRSRMTSETRSPSVAARCASASRRSSPRRRDSRAARRHGRAGGAGRGRRRR